MDISGLLSSLVVERNDLEIVRLMRIKPGPLWQIEPRCHDDSLIYLILDGGCVGSLDDQPCTWRSGELWWVAPGVRHRFRPLGGQELEMYVLRWHLAAVRWPFRWLRLEQGLQCRPTFDALLDAWHHPSPSQPETRLRCALAQLLIAIVDGQGSGHGGGLSSMQRQRCYDYLAHHLANDVMPDDLARVCDLGLGHFRRCFKRSFGCSPRSWIARERIRHAASLIRDGGLAVEAAAQACGYTSLPSFSRCFKQVMGRSPSAYR